ncbi:hypothetical protein IJD44_09375 [bacterium]|nr:hypothetical protein [bacterium]
MNILTANINKMDENAWKQKAFAEHAYTSNLISQTKNNSDKFEKTEGKKVDTKVKIASILGSLTGIAAAVGGIYALAKKKDPNTLLRNLRYDEPQLVMLGTGSILGGLTGGLLADKNKENRKPKFREALQQFFGSVLAPMGVLSVTMPLFEKTGFKLPQINSSSKIAKVINPLLATLPRSIVVILSLVGGMEVGNSIINKFNNKIFKENVKHEVKPEDYLVHSDDLCVAANFLFKDSKIISSITSKILPLTFAVSGAKTGMQQVSKAN